MQHRLENYVRIYGQEEGEKRYRARGEKISKARKKPHWAKFLNYPGVQDIVKDRELVDREKEIIDEFFEINPWLTHRKLAPMIARWLSQGVQDMLGRYNLLLAEGIYSQSYTACVLRYGETLGQEKYHQMNSKKTAHWPNLTQHWLNNGFTNDEAVVKVREVQHDRNKRAMIKQKSDSSWKSRHPGFKEYWVAKGLSQEEATSLVSQLQKRDLAFFTQKYGDEEGLTRYHESCARRRQTWTTKDKTQHAIVTTPKSYHPKGSEMRAINGFLMANNINPAYCKFGRPCDQFYQSIEGVGFRRWDLAVFSDENKTTLKLIFEFHGPGHINFSDYHHAMEHEPITICDKRLFHLGTYGDAYKNDMLKRNHILNKYPEVDYVVMWWHDLQEKRFKIDELRSRKI
jgi:hypothetical protein